MTLPTGDMTNSAEGSPRITIDLGQVSIDWKAQGTAWLEEVSQLVSRPDSPLSWGPIGEDLFMVAVGDDQLVVDLRDDADRCHLIVPQDELDETVIQSWLTAMDQATARTSDLQQFPW